MTAAITAYYVGKFIHVLAVVLAFGPTFGYAFFITAGERAGAAATVHVLRGLDLVDRYLVNVGMVIVLLTGLYTASEGDIDFGQSWVTIGLVAIVILLGMQHGFFRPSIRRALALAERDTQAGDELSAEYRAVSQRITTAGTIAGLIIVVAIFFMVVKP